MGMNEARRWWPHANSLQLCIEEGNIKMTEKITQNSKCYQIMTSKYLKFECLAFMGNIVFFPEKLDIATKQIEVFKGPTENSVSKYHLRKKNT